MNKIDIISVGRLKKGPLFELCEEYKTRIKSQLTIYELESKYSDPRQANDQENRHIADKINPQAFVIVMDERGDGLKSLDFAKTIEKLQASGEGYMQFIIGGADGLSNDIRSRADILLSFGQQTWPHMLARVMLLEQIYRCQQILAGHPYHRE